MIKPTGGGSFGSFSAAARQPLMLQAHGHRVRPENHLAALLQEGEGAQEGRGLHEVFRRMQPRPLELLFGLDA